MSYNLLDFFTLLGSLGIFLFGMKLMSEALQKVAGDKMRSILSAMTSTRIKGVFTGFLITAIIQSSSATTVMIVSFVNAGLLSLIQSIGVIMGANIGTTVTAWIISLLGFKINISLLALPIVGIGLPFIFSKIDIRKSWGEVIVGFAIIFLGLDFLKNSVPHIDSNPEILAFLQNYTGLGFGSVLIFLGIGTLLTMIIQSSSATMALTLVMCNSGWIPFELAAAMVLGENIGTTITANIAAMVANVSAKRAARAHLLFNLFGVIWVLFAFRLALNGINNLITFSGGESPFSSPIAIPIALSLFHTFFNIINTFILIWFSPYIANIATKLVPQKEEEGELSLKYIGTGLLSTSELSILQAKKEIIVYSERITKMFDVVKKLFHEKNVKKFHKLISKIEKYEDLSDKWEVEIAEYLTKISAGEISKSGSERIQALFRIINELESIADCNHNLSRTINRKRKKKVLFNEDMDTNVELMFEMISNAYDLLNDHLNKNFEEISIKKANEIEERINKLRDQFRKEHLKNVEKNKYDYLTGVIYNDIICECERMADHMINVSEALYEMDERKITKHLFN